MSKKANPALAEAKRAAILVREAITKQLRDGGPQTAAQVHAVIGGVYEEVRQIIYRMQKAGSVKSVRGADRAASTYRLSEKTTVARDVNKPTRPVLKEWAPNNKRDSLVCFLFGVPA